MSKSRTSILICTYGEAHWRNLAQLRALPSAQLQTEAHEIRAFHAAEGTLASVRNAAAREATGELLCFLDADDQLAPGYLRSMAEARSQRDGDALLYPSVQYVYDGREDPPVMLGHGRPLIELNRCVIGTLMPRDRFLELGGFGEMPALEDWHLFLRLSRHLPLVGVVNAVYRVHVRAQGRNANQGLYWQIRHEFESETKEIA